MRIIRSYTTFLSMPAGRLFFVGFLAWMISGCGNEESWSYKQWHNTLAHYNKFFNAEQKWLETVDLTREAFKDDPRKPITLFNYGDAATLKGNQAAMDEVIKRASTMIDRHPRSKWVDDAYLLNGKAYFMKGEITAAENLFTYVIEHFKDPISIYQAQLWIVRCLVMKNRLGDAAVLVSNLVKKPDFPIELTAQANFITGAIAIEQGNFQQAIAPLTKALPKTHQRMDRYRLIFALGECHLKIKEYAKAEQYFSKIAKFNPPYEIAFRAKMAQVTILSEQQENYTKANSILAKMLKDDKNLDFRSSIYLTMGHNEIKAKRDAIAIKRYQQAVYIAEDKVQKTNAYLALGDYYFGKKLYAGSARYYDSAFKIIDEKHPNFQAITTKNDVLGDLLKEVLVFTEQDSLLKMAKDADWRSKKISEAIAREKLEAQRAADAEKLKQQAKNGGGNAPGGFPGNPDFAPMNAGGGGMPTMGGSASFPFYTAAQRTKGIQDFERLWGKRSNADYWRYSNRKSEIENNSTENKNSEEKTESTNGNPSLAGNKNDGNNKGSGTAEKSTASDSSLMPKNIPAEEKRVYTTLPFSPSAQKEALAKIEKSTFNAAQIYQTRLAEPATAIELYIQLITRFPKSEYAPQAHYEIVKLCRSTGDYAMADATKSNLIEKYPKSIYVRMLESNSTAEISNTGKGSKSIDSMLSVISGYFIEEKYEDVINAKKFVDKQFAGNEYQAQFDFIYASAFIRSGNTKKGIDLMEQVSADYPTNSVGFRAKDICEAYRKLEAEKAQKESTANTSAGNPSGTNSVSDNSTVNNPVTVVSNGASIYKKWDGESEKLVIFAIPKGTNVNLTRSSLSDFAKKNFSFETLEISTAIPIGSMMVISIRNFSKPTEADKFNDYLSRSADLFLSKGIMEYKSGAITLENYAQLTKTLDLKSYWEFLQGN